VFSELECVGSAVTLTVTGGLSQTFVNGSEVTESCRLCHVSDFCRPLSLLQWTNYTYKLQLLIYLRALLRLCYVNYIACVPP